MNYVGSTHRNDQKQYAAGYSDGGVIITLHVLCIHLANIVQFINKSFFFTFRLEGVGGWSVLEERHYV